MLPPGGTIGVITPSTPANVLYREKYLHGVSVLRSLGFSVVEGMLTSSCRTQGYRAGTPEKRAAEFMELILNPDVACIISCIGGWNSSSMIPYLDFDVIRSNPKIFCGYSDVTSLHLAILARAGVSTFYGPAVMPTFGEWPTIQPYSLESWLDAVQRHTSGSRLLLPPDHWSNHFRDAKGKEEWKTVPREYQRNAGWRALRPGTITAPIIVANLNTLCTAAGTDYFPDLTGKILITEDAAAPLAGEERALRQLELMGVFDQIAGLIVGKPEFYNQQNAPFGLDELLLEIIGQREYPVVTEFDCSHTVPMLTLAQMAMLTVESGEGYDVRITLEQPMISL
ncbi:MAG: LD-carboxypeptidase [Armatimonadetes bacterium]|nr:LD-carboxypeptidase [Armatimonadota bacterium]